MNKHFFKENTYHPFRITNWTDNERCRMLSLVASMQDEGHYQATNRSGAFETNQLGLVVDDGFFQHFAIRRAQIGLEGEPVQRVFQWREQFDSIAKDFLSGERDGLFDSLASILPMQQQKWWSLFGKHWVVKNRHNNNDVKLMKWLMTGGNHGTIDTCGENIPQDVSSCKGIG